MADRFELHWCELDNEGSPSGIVATTPTFAVWPAPVNPDICFERAGFTCFADADASWEEASDRFLSRLLDKLQQHGEARLVSTPLRHGKRFLGRSIGGEPLSLREQIAWPTWDDNIPECVVRFGSDVELRTSQGHLLYWITLPVAGADEFERFVESIADGHEVIHSRIDLRRLCPSGQERT